LSSKHRLIRRNDIWYYRRRVPHALQSVIGKKEIQVSLATCNLKEAQARRAVEDLKWAAQFQNAANCPIQITSPATAASAPPQLLSEADVLQRVRDFVTTEGGRVCRALAEETFTREERREARVSIGTATSILRDQEDPRYHELVDASSTKIFPSDLAPGGATEAFLAEIVRRGIVELQQRKLAVLNDDHSREFFDTLFDPSHKSEVTFHQLTEQYLENAREDAAANGTSLKWIDRLRTFIFALEEIVGAQTPVRSIDYDVCLKVRVMLAKLPADRTKLYKGLGIDEAIAKGAAENAVGLSPKTQEQYLTTFRNVLGLAAKKRLLAINPAEDLKPLKREVLSNSQKRLPFDNFHLRDIFEGDYYRWAAAHHSPPYSCDPKGWRFWLPLICLFMGLRPNEACQMRPFDVKCTQLGTWYFDIVATEDDEEDTDGVKTLKTATSRRRVPVHPELIAIGLIDYARSRQAHEAPLLFAGIKADQYGNHAKYVLKRFREEYLPKATKLQPRQSFYSFRHNFRDALRRAEAPPDALQALGGWSQGSLVSDNYGERDHPDYQRQFMAKVSFPELDLKFLYVQQAFRVA